MALGASRSDVLRLPGCMALAASLIPARRAAFIDPRLALKEQ